MQSSRKDSVSAQLAAMVEQEENWHGKCISSIQEMAEIIEAVVTTMAQLGYPPKDIFGTRLALEEAICNAIKHGHRHDPTKLVEIRYSIRADHFLVAVEDQGPGFDPSQVPDATARENLERPSGRGLLLMRHYTAWLRHNRNGNCVTFCINPSEPLPLKEAVESGQASVGVSLCSIDA
jgi:serine/threonine-protein kinase RsbW